MAAALLVVAGVVAWAGIARNEGPKPYPAPALDASPSTPPTPSPQDAIVPGSQKFAGLKFAYCLATDRVVRLEEPLLIPPIRDRLAKAKLRAAQRIAQIHADNFAKAGFDVHARHIQAWADGFAQGRQMIDSGTRAIDALRPAVHAYSVTERSMFCEGDA